MTTFEWFLVANTFMISVGIWFIAGLLSRRR
jgi:hypothetical protein